MELDAVDLVVGDTALTCDQGGVSARPECSAAASPCATRRRRRAGCCWSRRRSSSARRWTSCGWPRAWSAWPAIRPGASAYGQLVEDGFFRTKLEWNGQYGNGLVATGKAKPKSPKDYTWSAPRRPGATSPARCSATSNMSPTSGLRRA